MAFPGVGALDERLKAWYEGAEKELCERCDVGDEFRGRAAARTQRAKFVGHADARRAVTTDAGKALRGCADAARRMARALECQKPGAAKKKQRFLLAENEGMDRRRCP